MVECYTILVYIVVYAMYANMSGQRGNGRKWQSIYHRNVQLSMHIKTGEKTVNPSCSIPDYQTLCSSKLHGRLIKDANDYQPHLTNDRDKITYCLQHHCYWIPRSFTFPGLQFPDLPPSSSLTWDQASEICEQDDSKLVSLTDEEELEFLKDAFSHEESTLVMIQIIFVGLKLKKV